MASMKAAEAMEWGKDQGPRKEAKGRFCITTVKSSPKLTSRACDTDTCVALETGALFPLDHPQWGGGTESTWSQAGRKLQSQAPRGAWYSIPTPCRGFPTVSCSYILICLGKEEYPQPHRGRHWGAQGR